MSVNERLINALSPISPAYPWIEQEGNLDEKHSRYFVFNYSTIPYGFAENVPHFERYLIQVHYFCPVTDSTVEVRNRIKRTLFESGFTWPQEQPVGQKNQTGQHYCFECETLEEIPNGEN